MNVISSIFKVNYKNILLVIIVIFNFYFPKGGFKISNIPITWGYLLFYILVTICFVKKISNGFQSSLLRWRCMIMILPFQLFTLGTLIINGYDDIGWALSFFLNVVFIPTSMIIILDEEIENLDLLFLHKILKYGMIFLCLFGLIHFVYGFLNSGESLEIPYLTVNGADEDILNAKHNNRGGIYKLISTYNNGNIFGTSMLLVLPFYEYLEKSKVIKVLLKITLFLTIARTVWIGLVINEFLKIFYASTSGKISTRVIIGSLLFITILGLSVFFTSDIFFSEVDVLDPELGGRSYQLEFLTNAKLINTEQYTQIAEILYLSIIKNFGILGFVLFIPFLFSPILLNFNTKNSGKKIILVSLINYVIIAGSDGAFQYIPIMLFYWFMGSLSLRKNIFEKSANEKKAFGN